MCRLADALKADLEEYVFVYLYDGIICTSTFEKHVDVLKEVKKRLLTLPITGIDVFSVVPS